MIRENFPDSAEYSLMEVVKQTIIKQDYVFRMQVQELHRLYRVQKFLSGMCQNPSAGEGKLLAADELTGEKNVVDLEESSMGDSVKKMTDSCESSEKKKCFFFDLNEAYVNEESSEGEKSSEHEDSLENEKQAADTLLHLCTAADSTAEEPEPSIDSFEDNVLKLTEEDGETCVCSSAGGPVVGGGRKDNGVKLRRGRRMKNFQKEILPSMACLAMQEIREDIGIMEGALRSREYRKRAKMVLREHNWSEIKRSRRSRLSHVRPRTFT